MAARTLPTVSLGGSVPGASERHKISWKGNRIVSHGRLLEQQLLQ